MTHSLTAQLADELDLKIGQLVRVTYIIDKDWYRSVILVKVSKVFSNIGTGQQIV